MKISWFTFLILCIALSLISTITMEVISTKVQAAPAGGQIGKGGGPKCPPTCPPTAANCDSNLVFSQIQDLNFGILSAPAAGTVTVSPSGLPATTAGGIILLAGSATTPAVFNLVTTPYDCTGRTYVAINVASPASLTGPGPSMTLDSFDTIPVAGDLHDPTIPLIVGATLHIGALQPAGPYSGNFSVTVSYQ